MRLSKRPWFLEEFFLTQLSSWKGPSLTLGIGLGLVVLGCSKPKETQNLEIKVTSPGIGVVSSAQVSIDGRPVGVSNGQGIWRGRLTWEAQSRHKISVTVEKEGYYFSPWQFEFTADGKPVSQVANLFSVPKLTGSETPVEVLDSEVPAPALDPIALWRKSYTKYVASLPPMMPWSSAYLGVQEESTQAEGSPETGAGESLNGISTSEESRNHQTNQTSTFYVHSQGIAQEGVQFWIGAQEAESVCTTNRRGRCTVSRPSPVISQATSRLSSPGAPLLVTKEGFKSILARPRGDGTHYLKMERGLSRDLFIAARDEGWKITSRGLEVVRGVGPGFVVLDQEGDDFYLECGSPCTTKPQAISWAVSGLTTIKPNFSGELLPLHQEKPYFAGDYLGSLDQEFAGVQENFSGLLKKNGFRKASHEDKNPVKLAFGVVKNKSSENREDQDFLFEVLFLSPKGDILGASLKSCDSGREACFRNAFQQAYETSRPLTPKDPGPTRRDVIGEKKEEALETTEIRLTDDQGNGVSGARLYGDGIYLGKSREQGEILVKPLGSQTLEVVKEGFAFYRSYIPTAKASLAITLAQGSRVVFSQNKENTATLFQGGLEVGKIPGVYGVRPLSLEVDPGDKQKKLNLLLTSGKVLDLSPLKFHPDLFATWEKQVLSGDLSGAEKTLNEVTQDHPDWIPLAYLRSEKQFVEKGTVSEDWNDPNLSAYPTARWLKGKATIQQALEGAKEVEELKTLDSMMGDILLVSGEGPSREFFSELHYLKALTQLKISMISKDDQQSRLALRKVNEWFELGYGSQSDSFGRRMWNLAREQSLTHQRGM